MGGFELRRQVFHRVSIESHSLAPRADRFVAIAGALLIRTPSL
jgi:hypothetical protein